MKTKSFIAMMAAGISLSGLQAQEVVVTAGVTVLPTTVQATAPPTAPTPEPLVWAYQAPLVCATPMMSERRAEVLAAFIKDILDYSGELTDESSSAMTERLHQTKQIQKNIMKAPTTLASAIGGMGLGLLMLGVFLLRLKDPQTQQMGAASMMLGLLGIVRGIWIKLRG